MPDLHVLVTGGAGYIGTHTLVAMLAAGQRPLVLDDFSNGSREAVRRVERLCGVEIPLVEGDIRSPGLVESVLAGSAARGAPVRAVL
ncbi:KR domain-containing protein, partial [Achromobacter sp.]